MDNKNIKKCLACGLPVVIVAGILYESTPFCHHCLLHRQEHLPENMFSHEQFINTTSGLNITASPSPENISTLESEDI